MSSTGIAVGLNKGFPVNKKQVAARPASRKGVRAGGPRPGPGMRPWRRVLALGSTLLALTREKWSGGRVANDVLRDCCGWVDWCVQRAGKKTKLVREVIREVVGLMPYEKRILDMIKSGGSSAE
ncbi:hypothetical protein BBJ28_00015727, partial [Nothophytophthora sp. Chile5]